MAAKKKPLHKTDRLTDFVREELTLGREDGGIIGTFFLLPVVTVEPQT